MAFALLEHKICLLLKRENIQAYVLASWFKVGRQWDFDPCKNIGTKPESISMWRVFFKENYCYTRV